MSTPRLPRLPVAPLLELMAAAGISRHELIRTTRIDISKRKQAGTINLYDADRAAVACGHHPAEIWGDQWADNINPTEATA